jgi:hypothetical protein
MSEGTDYVVVYHLAVIHHWEQIVREQFPFLMRNQRIGALCVCVASNHDEHAMLARETLESLFALSRRKFQVEFKRCALKQYEHPAIELADAIARAVAFPVMYFHGKSVRYNPPSPLHEKWRQYLNGFLAQADRWAAFIQSNPQYDVVGPMLMHEPDRDWTFFAGNYWIARSEYLRSLTPYAQFLNNPGENCYFKRKDRHLAEVAINRDKRMRPYATDVTLSSMDEFVEYLARADVPS